MAALVKRVTAVFAGTLVAPLPDASRPRSERSSPSPPLRRSGWLYWPEDYRIDPELRWSIRW